MLAVPRLHLITPPDGHPGVTLVPAVLRAGAPLVQLRMKDITDRVRFDRAEAMAEVCRAHGATLIVNDRADVAAAVGAGGVHLGDDDLPTAAARALLGPSALIGATVRNPEAARRAADAGASYLGVGPVYATTTKSGLPDPLGPAAVEAIVRVVDLPVIAVAGVTAAQVPELLDAGAWGVAVVGAVFSAPDPTLAVEELLDVLP